MSSHHFKSWTLQPSLCTASMRRLLLQQLNVQEMLPQERREQLMVFRGRMPAEQQESAWWLNARTQVQLHRPIMTCCFCATIQANDSMPTTGHAACCPEIGSKSDQHCCSCSGNTVSVPFDGLLLCGSQAQLAAEMGLAGDMAFTVRSGTPLLATQAQVWYLTPHKHAGPLCQCTCPPAGVGAV